MTVDELFGRCEELATSELSVASNRFMHETLVLCCAEALKLTGTGFGNLFSQVDYLAKHAGMTTADRMTVQQMRRHSNRREVFSREDWLQDVRALTLFVSAVFKTAVPDELVQLIPHHSIHTPAEPIVNARYLRCVVSSFDGQTIEGDTSDGAHVIVDYTAHQYLKKILREGMQLNLLDSHVEKEGTEVHGVAGVKVQPGIIVVEPDFLIDISSLAHCFQGSYGHHPLLYTVERLKPREVSQAMLLGNFAGTALDDIVHERDAGAQRRGSADDSLRRSFREQALQFCTCEGFNGQTFNRDARQQYDNICEAVDALFGNGEAGGYDRQKALLEPSFVCERLGLQGRVDLMTSDMRLLVEQKSGKNYNLEREAQTSGTGLQKEEHYVQLLLYYGVLRYNFGRTDSQVDIRLLYSRYPAARGLLYVNFYRELFREAIRLRNQIVATELLIAREGFGRILPLLRPDVVFRDAERDGYFHHYVEPPVLTLMSQLSCLQPLERAYYERMMTFVYREQLLQKVGYEGAGVRGCGGSTSDLWNMPLAEKMETGNIIVSGEQGGQPNFRRGDMVYVYNYDSDEPDVRRSILYKATIEQIDDSGVKVRLMEQQQGIDPMQQGRWAIEHGGSDQNTTSAIKSLHQFITASPEKRSLLLGQRMPRHDASLRLSRSYHPDYDDVILRAKQSRDYFLLVGPPGTGKTSMALRFLVEEELSSSSPSSSCSPCCGGAAAVPPSLLLMSYTNRAVDEICAMLDDAGFDYLRIGSESSCDPRFKPHLLEYLLGDSQKLSDIRQHIIATPVIVATTSMLQARSFIFQLKHFSLCIVDEASQILEPGIVGLLANDSIGRFILIGDHKQLPAVVQQSEQASRVDDPLLNAIGITDCRHSLFERLLRWERLRNAAPPYPSVIGILRKQGRMHPDIAEFPNSMFYHDEHLEPVPLAHQTDSSLHYDLPAQDATDALLKQRRVLFFDVPFPSAAPAALSASSAALSASSAVSSVASAAVPSASSAVPFVGCAAAVPQPSFSDKSNAAEARLIADLLRRILRFYGERFNPNKSVGVIVPYRNQIAMIRQKIAQLALPQLADISIDTVERYQGSQRDVIIYSFTVSRPYQLDFLTSNCFEEQPASPAIPHPRTIDRKLNVAITRARKQLLLVGNAALLQRNPLFCSLINSIKDHAHSCI